MSSLRDSKPCFFTLAMQTFHDGHGIWLRCIEESKQNADNSVHCTHAMPVHIGKRSRQEEHRSGTARLPSGRPSFFPVGDRCSGT